MQEPIAFVSYQSNDACEAELIHQEFALRGFEVIHDRCTFSTGSRVLDHMQNSVERCDVFIAYATPSYLYEGVPSENIRPAIDNEFKPLIARLRHSRGNENKKGGIIKPIVMVVAHGLGEPRSQAPQRIKAATGEDVSGFWMPVIINQDTAGITTEEAGRLAREAIRSFLDPADLADGVVYPLELVVATRGQEPPRGSLTLDGTMLLGGAMNKPGAPDEWKRWFVALRDVEAALARLPGSRKLKLSVHSHLTGAISVGRVFHQAAGWRLSVRGRGGWVERPDSNAGNPLVVSLDAISQNGDLSVEIDLLGAPVFDMATNALSNKTIARRLQIWRDSSDLIDPNQVPAFAAFAANEIRKVVSETRPSIIHLFCSSPVEFAVFLGHELTSLFASIQLYERSGNIYSPSLSIDSTAA